MWTIKQIFDGDYGCEETEENGMVSVTLGNENGEERWVSVKDAWLTEMSLDIGNKWPGRFWFHSIKPDEVEEVTEIEQICFPPNEACSPKSMAERVRAAAELFLVAKDIETGKIAGFLNGLSTKETIFRDEFFTDASLYDPDGENVMLLGLDVRPEYRRKGLAREIVRQYVMREADKGRRRLILTCLDSKIEMYRKFGFRDLGIANSSWGGEKWHEMDYQLKREER